MLCAATIDEVTDMLKELQPTQIYSNWMYKKTVNISDVSAEKKYIVCGGNDKKNMFE